MAFIGPMHRNKPNITYLLTYFCNCQNDLGVLSVDFWHDTYTTMTVRQSAAALVDSVFVHGTILGKTDFH